VIRAVASAALLFSCGGYRAHPPATDGPGVDAGNLPDCDSQPDSAGCPCESAEPVVCYEGPDGTLGVGPCGAGIQACNGGRWSACAGQVLPTAEACDGRDDDCNGVVDDACENACGNSDPECASFLFGPADGARPFDPPPGDCMVVNGKGGLVMDPPLVGTRVAWIPNTPDGTISRIDTATREEEGRYRTGPTAGAEPSRTSVDHFGSVYVANRAPGDVGSVTRILAEDCVDADGDGDIETSEGRGDVWPWGDDECVYWHAEVGGVDSRANAVSAQFRVGLDGVVDERAWVGLENERTYLELDAEGEWTGVEVSVLDCSPVGSVIDRDERLWSSCRDPLVANFDTADPEDREVMVLPSGSGSGIAVDGNGGIWFGGEVTRYEPDGGEWTTLPGVVGWGVTAYDDDFLWVGACSLDGGAQGTCQVDLESLEVDWYDMESRAVGIDSDGWLWGVPSSGSVDLIDAWEPGDVETILDGCDGPGGACLTTPDAYGDMITFDLHHHDPVCAWGTILEGCGDGWTTRWARMEWDADEPPGTMIWVQVRTADSLAELAAGPWLDAGEFESPIDLETFLGDASDDALLEVRLNFMSADREAVPTLRSFGVHRSCH